MKKFKIVKRFPLDFLGEEWKEAYINFQRVTIADIKNVFPKFRAVDSKNDKEIIEGIDDMVKFLKEKFVSGKGIIEDGSLVDLEVDDLETLPAEVMSRALGFLSQGVTPASPKP